MSLEEARAALGDADPEECLRVLKELPDDVSKFQLSGEALLEMGETQAAYDMLKKATDLDPEGDFGYDKFLWMGQLTGGFEGRAFFEKGIEGLKKKLDDEASLTESKQKIVNGILSLIEIWMTDLCMEPDAESQCVRLIEEAIAFAPSQPEVWNIAGSIRLSQQKDDEAKEALIKSKDLYLADINNLNGETISSLVRLAQSLMEIDLFDDAREVTKHGLRIDDQVPDLYFLHGLAYFNKYKLTNEAKFGSRARDSWTSAVEFPDVDPDIVQFVNQEMGQVEGLEYDGPDSDDENEPLDGEI